MKTKEELIHRLQDEIIFLQETKFTDSELEYYNFNLKGNLSESRFV